MFGFLFWEQFFVLKIRENIKQTRKHCYFRNFFSWKHCNSFQNTLVLENKFLMFLVDFINTSPKIWRKQVDIFKRVFCSRKQFFVLKTKHGLKLIALDKWCMLKIKVIVIWCQNWQDAFISKATNMVDLLCEILYLLFVVLGCHMEERVQTTTKYVQMCWKSTD